MARSIPASAVDIGNFLQNLIVAQKIVKSTYVNVAWGVRKPVARNGLGRGGAEKESPRGTGKMP